MHFGVRYAILTSRAETKEFPRGKFTSGATHNIENYQCIQDAVANPEMSHKLFAFKTFMIQKTVRLIRYVLH